MKIADRYEPNGNAKWGGMGEVHECNDLHLARKVMLKRVKRTSDARRLIDEYKSLLQIRSKHVVELLDIVTFDYMGAEETGIVLEYIDGSALEEGTFTYGVPYLKTLWQIASGIAEIHAAGIIHRDIKPDNILVDNANIVKILDFGLARETGKDNKTRSIVGTRGFMAPELTSDKTVHFGPPIDIYAFGITALSLISPLDQLRGADAATEIQTALGSNDPQLATLLIKCVHKEPSERPLATEICNHISRKLTFNTHRARIVNGTQVLEINSNSRASNINTSIGSIRIEYDGNRFYCSAVQGSVTINNRPIKVGDDIQSTCLIMFGIYGSNDRAFVPFNVSIPEVVV